MFGWLSDASVFASRSKRIRRSGSLANDSGRIFSATSRSSLVSRARYTSPMPPAPILAAISYGPKRAPEARAMAKPFYGVYRFRLPPADAHPSVDAAALLLGAGVGPLVEQHPEAQSARRGDVQPPVAVQIDDVVLTAERDVLPRRGDGVARERGRSSIPFVVV